MGHSFRLQWISHGDGVHVGHHVDTHTWCSSLQFVVIDVADERSCDNNAAVSDLIGDGCFDVFVRASMPTVKVVLVGPSGVGKTSIRSKVKSLKGSGSSDDGSAVYFRPILNQLQGDDRRRLYH